MLNNSFYDRNITEFPLAPTAGACIHTPFPQAFIQSVSSCRLSEPVIS
ncbi:DUF3299 domain-containing protein [Stappia sp. GBMRC 2046]|uniref:DUF3299 domain-containing protein n=1 Tax=Stappia sediminis TaxID=2692190 RepID=A0A7X3S6E5_9HYPH|nr:DUF3299 domain-containing protein [Stappia sediminis]